MATIHNAGKQQNLPSFIV